METELRPPDPPRFSPDRQRRRREQVLEGYQRLQPTQRRRVRLVAAVVIPALLLVGTAGVAAYARLRPGPVTVLEAGVGCFEKPSLRADVAIVDLRGLDPVERCREVWASGALPRGRLDKIMATGRSTPTLISCIFPTGALAVFPGQDPADCGRLGLREPAPGELARLQRFDAFKQAVIQRYFAASDCVDPKVARQGVERLLKAHQMDGWRVVTLDEVEAGAARFDKQRPCALLDLRANSRLVVLHPDPRPGSDRTAP
jgi:hypothetical protein